jgi:DNA-binding CsgD family transcriptional regulator
LTLLIGRESEFAAIDRILQDALRGKSEVLILKGEPGIGKSALLDAAAERADGMRVLRAAGVESEITMPFAGLHQLLRPVMEHIDRTTGSQASALRGALGLGDEPPDSIFLVGAALLTLLAEVAEERPLLFLIDDAHWLDQPSASALAFAARRLEAERIAGLIAIRADEVRDSAITGLPSIEVKGLEATAADCLLDDLGRQIAPEVRLRLIRETGGNPLALKELPLALNAAQLDGRAPLPAWLPLSDRLTRAYGERVRRLGPGIQRLLLVASMDESISPDMAVAAATRLGAGGGDLTSAEESSLIFIQDGTIGFRHPLIRSAVYQAATGSERLKAHRALAEVLVGKADHDRQVWHRAAGIVGPDAQVAAALEAVANATERHHGPAAAAAGLERSAALTGNESIRAHRLARAAEVNLAGGQRNRARALLIEAESIAADPRVRAEILFTQARLVAQTSTYANTDLEMLLNGADLVAQSDPEFAAHMLCFANVMTWHAHDWSATIDVARRLLALDLPEDSRYKRHARDMLNSVQSVSSVSDRFLEAASEAFEEQNLAWERWLPPPGMAELSGMEAPAHRLLLLAEPVLRNKGAIWGLIWTLLCLANTEYLLGRWSSSLAHDSEALALSRQTGHDFNASVALAKLARLAASKGEEATCNELLDELQSFESTSWVRVSFTSWALAQLDLGHGRTDEAFERLARLAPINDSWPERFSVALRASGDIVEAAIRSGHKEEATKVLEGLARWAGPRPPAWAQVYLHRGRGMLARDPESAGAHLQAAVSVPGGEQRPWEHARTRLVYGEWLRRQRHKTEARIQLHAALDIFDRLGAKSWSEQARNELRATGENISRHDLIAPEHLTPQELQIARLAALGMTNRQIGSQLFLSPRTVATHLYRMFPKLGIASRSDLRGLNLDDGHLIADAG